MKKKCFQGHSHVCQHNPKLLKDLHIHEHMSDIEQDLLIIERNTYFAEMITTSNVLHPINNDSNN